MAPSVSVVARKYSVSVGPFRIHAFFGVTLALQILNTALRHLDRGRGYRAYILLLEFPLMLINLCAIYGFQTWLWKRRAKNTGRSDEAADDVYRPVLWSFGSLTMPPTASVSEDARLAAAAPLASAALSLVWLVIYGLSDRFEFDETFSDGVDEAEMDTFAGVWANAAAQSFWRCLPLALIQAFLPAYPLSSSALLAGGLVSRTGLSHRRVGLATDVAGTFMATCVFLTGIYETVWDDDNGCGIWYLFNATVLLVFTVPRLFSQGEEQEHPLMGRPCYRETEDGQDVDETVKEGEGNDSEQFSPEPTNIV